MKKETSKKVYQLWVSKVFEHDTFLYDTYRDKASAYRTIRKLKRSEPGLTFEIVTLHEKEYDHDMPPLHIKMLHQKGMCECHITIVCSNHHRRPWGYKEMTSDELWLQIQEYLDDCDYHLISYQRMLKEIKMILSECNHIGFCRKLNELNLCNENMVLLLVICNCLINKNEDFAALHDYDSIIPSTVCNKIIKQFQENTNELIEKELVETMDSTCENFRLTDSCRAMLLADYA